MERRGENEGEEEGKGFLSILKVWMLAEDIVNENHRAEDRMDD